MSKLLIVEVGIKLEKSLDHYISVMAKNDAVNVFNCETRDLYWTKQSFTSMTENEIKKSCVRYRMCKGFGGKYCNSNQRKWICSFQNYQVFSDKCQDSFKCHKIWLPFYENYLVRKGWKKVFDTYKKDFQYIIGDMKSRIQLQDIDGIGLVLYYDNPNYYHMPLEEQRKSLIDELNSYGFDLGYDTMGLDKLRTLWNGKECFSLNQNS